MHGCCLEDAAQGSCCCMLICCPSISCWFLESCGGGWQALDHCSTLEHSPALGMSGVTTVWAWDGDGGGCSVLAVGRKCPKAMLEGSSASAFGVISTLPSFLVLFLPQTPLLLHGSVSAWLPPIPLPRGRGNFR